MAIKDPAEIIARALCTADGHLENATMAGKPLWQDYLPEANAVLAALARQGMAIVDQ